MEKILVVEDNASMREMLESILEEKGYQTRAVGDVETALLHLKKQLFSVILSDLQLPDIDGLTFFKKIKHLGVPFIILTAYGTIEQAVEAMKEGAFDFIAKPVDPDYLFLIIDKALESTRIRRENILFHEIHSSTMAETRIIGKTRCIRDEAEKIKNVAVTDTPVLLLGESGTGKELFARAIHNLSPRREKPFMAVNSASIPETLLENELFGHEKGSYTDAYVRQIGKLELTQGGTFFLDEIGDLPTSLQGKLLRVIEEKTINRIGSSREITLDVRFVFATNKDIQHEVEAGRFRKDLYFRISVFPVTLPPLREREEDILLLADYFIKKFARDLKKPEIPLSDEARKRLLAYNWPGNVRELQNTIERALIVASGNSIEPRDIMLPQKPLITPDSLNLDGNLKQAARRAVQMVEKAKISAALENSGFNKTETARALDISYKTLLDKIKRYGIKKRA